jgi:hypothetical protein
MTSTITILCPQGIVMAADSRISYVDSVTGQPRELMDDVKKIFYLRKAKVGISYWGLATIQGKPMLDFLQEIEDTFIQEEDKINDVAEKLLKRLHGTTPRIRTRMGLHIAGYVREGTNYIPKLQHIFHERWHSDGEFTNENCHLEYHSNGKKILFHQYYPYPVLFNGDNAVANCLFNYIPHISGQKIRTDLLTLDECLDLAELILSVSIQRLDFYFTRQEDKVFRSVGGPIHIGRIKLIEGFDWYKE